MKAPQSPRIALISGVPAAIAPATHALDDQFPEAVVWNILDDRLIDDATAAGEVTPALADRMRRLITHAVTEGADAVLVTCSLYGHIATSAALDSAVPVFGPDDAAFNAIALAEYREVILVSSVELALADSLARLTATLTTADSTTVVTPLFAPGALTASKHGDHGAMADCLIAAIDTSGITADAILFAQYSLTPAAQAVEAATSLPVVTGPTSAAAQLRDLLRRGDA